MQFCTENRNVLGYINCNLHFQVYIKKIEGIKNIFPILLWLYERKTTKACI